MNVIIASSLPHVAECGAGQRPVRASSMVQQTSHQTGNRHLVNSLSGSQLMWQIYLYLPGILGKSGTRNRVQNFNGIAWVSYFEFLDDFILL